MRIFGILIGGKNLFLKTIALSSLGYTIKASARISEALITLLTHFNAVALSILNCTYMLICKLIEIKK